MPSIFVIGSSNTDMVICSESHPKPGETVMGNHFLINPGGKGANQAVAAARLGGLVVFVAKLGDDLFGRQAIDHFKKEGIQTEYISFETEQPSGVALITVDAKGENTIVVAAGANQFLSKKEIESVSRSFQKGDFALFQLEIPLQTVHEGIKRANEKGLKTILNPAPAQPLPANLLKNLYAITPNETEASLLTGILVVDVETAQLAANSLLDMGVENVIITLGSKGALYVSENQSMLIETKQVDAIDTTAAGDCFNGALTFALCNGLDWKMAIEFACKAATFSVTRMGAQASMPYLKDIS
ncbi:MAG: ribokinase [Bacteroidota bacterium]|jgi:ribokinase